MGIVDVALSQEGIKETGLNNVKYNTWYYGFAESNGSKPWCAVFVCWCAEQAGCSKAVYHDKNTGVTKTASVSSLYSFYRSNGLFQPKGNGYRPKAGDIMIQKSGGASHTGIVYAANANKFFTIEGNTSDCVAKRSYSYDDYRLTGFGTPNYSGIPMNGTNVPLPGDDYDNTGSGSYGGEELGVGSYDYTDYIVKPGDTLQSIADKFHCTPAMIIFVNNLESNELTVGQTIKVPTALSTITDPLDGVGVITKKHTTGVEVSKPTIEAMFFTEYGMLASVSTTGITEDESIDNDIISVNTVRNQSQDCPTFSMSLVWRNNWYKNLASNDLVIIRMQRPPEKMDEVFFGLIDDIRKSVDFSSGKPQRAVQVTGRGFAKAFVNFDVGLVSNLSINPGTGFMSNQLNLSGVNSYDAIKLILDSYVGKAIKYSFGSGKKFEDYFHYDGNSHEGEKLCDITSYNSYVGSLWNFIKELSNSPFNETFWEIYNGKPNLIHRRTPFNKEEWIKLNRTLIQDTDIVSDNTGRSDLETYTLFSVETKLFDDTSSTFYNPLWYPPYYSKYGINMLKIATNYQLWSDGEMGIDLVRSFYQDLFNFNIKNNIFHNGTIVVKGKALYKIGERIIIESENMEYYVESVTHNFNCYGSWTTTLGVTRGIEPENRFTPPWGCAEEFTPSTMQAIVNQTSGEEIDWSNLPDVNYNTGMIPDDYPYIDEDASSNEKSCYNFFKGNMELNTAAATAILANIDQESSFRTSSVGDGGTSYGICQWHNSRFDRLKDFCFKNRLNYMTINGQLAYLKHELENSYPNVLNKLKNIPDTIQGAYDAAYYWCVHFEVPANKEMKGRERGNIAKRYYQKYRK